MSAPHDLDPRDPADYWADPGYLAALDDDDPGPDGVDGVDGPAEKVFEHHVEKELRRLQIRDEAQRRHRAEHIAPRPRFTLLDDFLAVDDPPARYRIEGLLPIGGRALLAAQFKAGKTTMMENLVRALADGEEFLGRAVAAPAGRIVLIDDEMDARQLRVWLREQQIHQEDRVAVLPLRGAVSSFNLLDPAVRAEWVADLTELQPEIVILDCLRPILDAIGLDEDKEAGLFLVAFDELLAACGASEAVVVHHMGHAGERSRGSSRLRDWPDVEWRLVRQDPDDPSSPRYFTAYGRDVDVAEAELGYDAVSRRYSVVGGTRRDAEARGLLDGVVELLLHRPALTGREVEAALTEGGAPRAAARAALKQAVVDGLVVTGHGKHRSVLHWAATDPVRRRGTTESIFDSEFSQVSTSAPVRRPPRSERSSGAPECADEKDEENPRSQAQCASAPQCAEPCGAECASAPSQGRSAHWRTGRAQGAGETDQQDQNCSRCRRPAPRLIAGRCERCAYPAGGAPSDEHEESPDVDPARPPNFAGTYPLDGHLIGPAWRAAWAILAAAPDQWHLADDLAEQMTRTAEITDKTARNLLRSARHRELLDVAHDPPDADHKHPVARYRIAHPTQEPT